MRFANDLLTMYSYGQNTNNVIYVVNQDVLFRYAMAMFSLWYVGH